ncbi:hypothetical protein [Streptomyces sp. SYSU K217416]
MSPPDRKEDEVRRMLEGPHPAVPAELAGHAAERGHRILRRHRAAMRLLWLLLVVAATAFAVWAALAEPWLEPSSDIAPPLEGW